MNFQQMKNYLFFTILIGLTACGVQSQGNSEDFEEFYARFHEDSLFQIERVAFPLNGESSFLDDGNRHIKFWYLDEWQMQHSYDLNDTLGYEQNMISIADTMIVDVIYTSEAIGVTRYFSLRDGKWNLTFYSDSNPIDPSFINKKKKKKK